MTRSKRMLALSLTGIVAVATALVPPADLAQAAVGPTGRFERATSACYSRPPQPLTTLTSELQAALDGAGLTITEVAATNQVTECYPDPRYGSPTRMTTRRIEVSDPGHRAGRPRRARDLRGGDRRRVQAGPRGPDDP